MTDLILTRMDALLLTGGVALVGGLVRGFTGFGGPAIMIVVLTQFYSPTSVLPIVMLIDFAVNLRLVPLTLRDVSWYTAGPLTAASLACVPIGVYALMLIDPVIMKRIIAATVGVCSLSMLAGFRYHQRPKAAVIIAIGALAGLVLGATYIALVGMLFLFAGPDPAVNSRANAIFWGLAMGACMIAILSFYGMIMLSHVWRSAIVAIVYLMAASLGAGLFRSVKEETFRRIVLSLLIFLSTIGILT